MENFNLLKQVFSDDWLYAQTCKILDRHKSVALIEYKLKAFYKKEGLDVSKISWEALIEELTSE